MFIHLLICRLVRTAFHSRMSRPLLIAITGMIVFTLVRFAQAAEAALDFPIPSQASFDWWERVRLQALEVLFAFWYFTIGATIGSFLNVLVYRMPRGVSVMFDRSRCPKCETEIAGRDNIPILGWLMLRGRCRVCGLPISARYPTVELTCGLMFLVLFYVEFVSGGANLPNFAHATRREFSTVLLDLQWELVRPLLYHSFLFSTLLTWALIGYDRQAIPRRSVLTAIAFGAGLPLFWPELLPIAPVENQSGGPALWQTAATSLAGGVSGLLLGSITVRGLALVLRPEIEPRGSDSVLVETPLVAPESRPEPDEEVLAATAAVTDTSDSLMNTVTETAAGQCDDLELSFRSQTRGLTATAILLGVCLGWQAVLSCVALGLAVTTVRLASVWFLVYLPGVSRLRWGLLRWTLGGDLFLAAFVHHIGWQPYFGFETRLGSQPAWLAGAALAWLVGFVAVCFAMDLTTRQVRSSEQRG